VGYLILAGLIATPAVIYAVASKEYRMRRILAYLDPFAHQNNEGYQVAESLMSFGAGGVTGVGIGDSRQKLFFLPEAHTDFISAIVAEELGLLGLTCLVIAYIVIVHRGVLAAYRAADDYGTQQPMEGEVDAVGGRPVDGEHIRAKFHGAQGGMQGQRMTDRTAFTIRGNDDHPAD
jgi:hypothetical protein